MASFISVALRIAIQCCAKARRKYLFGSFSTESARSGHLRGTHCRLAKCPQGRSSGNGPRLGVCLDRDVPAASTPPADAPTPTTAKDGLPISHSNFKKGVRARRQDKRRIRITIEWGRDMEYRYDSAMLQGIGVALLRMDIPLHRMDTLLHRTFPEDPLLPAPVMHVPHRSARWRNLAIATAFGGQLQ